MVSDNYDSPLFITCVMKLCGFPICWFRSAFLHAYLKANSVKYAKLQIMASSVFVEESESHFFAPFISSLVENPV